MTHISGWNYHTAAVRIGRMTSFWDFFAPDAEAAAIYHARNCEDYESRTGTKVHTISIRENG